MRVHETPARDWHAEAGISTREGRMNIRRKLTVFIALCLTSAAFSPAKAQEMPAEYRQVLDSLSRKGDFSENVLRVGIPRNDLEISIAGIKTPTSFGFGGWLGFTKGDHGMDVMMGDLVLLQEEVNPVMSALLANGLEVTALHNHFFWDVPHVYYMHVHGHGNAADIARKVKPALDLIGHVRATGDAGQTVSAGELPVTGVRRVAEGKLNKENLDRIIGHKGAVSGPVYKVTIGRSDIALKEMGAVINSRMGFNSWAALFGADDNAAIAGDVAMLEHEVTPVLNTLRKNGLDVVAIHHHMTGTEPMIIFLHYWGVGPAEKLAAGFRAALDELGKHEQKTMHGGTHEQTKDMRK
jgi:hypothetical protein